VEGVVKLNFSAFSVGSGPYRRRHGRGISLESRMKK